MWGQVIDFFKKLLGGEGTSQIGKDQQAVSGTTSGVNSPVITAGGDVNYNVGHPAPAPSAAQRDAELLAEMEELMPEIIQGIRDLLTDDPLLRDLVVFERSTICYNIDRPHGKFCDDTHPDARRKFGILESHGLVRQRNKGFYEISPRFVRMLTPARVRKDGQR